MPDRTVVAIDSLPLRTGESKEAPDLHLIEGGIIMGRVLDAATGMPVNFKKSDYADITLSGPSRPRSGAAVEVAPIAADGSYQLRAAPGRNNVHFRSTNWDAGADSVMVREGELVVKDFLVVAGTTAMILSTKQSTAVEPSPRNAP
jgi:hypothetical protein